MKFKKQKQSVRQRPGSNRARPKAFSYYGQRQRPTADQPLPASRQMGRSEATPRGQTLKFIIQRFGAVLAIIAVLLLLVTSVQVDMKPRVSILNQSTSLSLHTSSDYQTAAEQIMKRSWTNTNKLTIDTQSIARQLQASFPEIADASIALPLVSQRPVVYLQLTEPQLLLTNHVGQAYVIDETGRALADAAQLDATVAGKLPTITDESGLRITQGQIALSSADVNFIKTVLYQFDKAGIKVGKVTLPQGSRQLNVYIYKKPYFVKFNLQEDDAKQQAGAFIAVKRQLDRRGKAPRQYIDVRLPGRAYYK